MVLKPPSSRGRYPVIVNATRTTPYSPGERYIPKSLMAIKPQTKLARIEKILEPKACANDRVTLDRVVQGFAPVKFKKC